MEKSLAVRNETVSIFQASGSLTDDVQKAKMLAAASLVPQHFQGERNIPNALIAMDLAARMGKPPMEVMQNLYVIQGRPSWSSSHVISVINQSGRFGDVLRFKYVGNPGSDGHGCVAWTTLKSTGEVIEGPLVDIAMAKAEGWYGRTGSKWKTMPGIMLSYRAASFFARLYANDLLYGMDSSEVEFLGTAKLESAPTQTAATLTQELLGEEEAVILAPTPEETAVLIPDEPTPEPDLPSEDEKKDLWREYEEIFGNRNHAVNAAKLVTDGRGSKEWTNTDLKNLKADMKRRVAEKKDDAPAEKEKAPAKGKEKPKEALKEKPGSWSFSDGDDAGAEEDAENTLF